MNILEMQQELNLQSERYEDGRIFYFEKNEDFIKLTITDNEEEDEVCVIEVDKTENSKELVIALIDGMYQEYINPKTKIIKNWKTFSSSKIKQLETALLKQDLEKVNNIQQELIKRNKEVQVLKLYVSDYKSRIITPLYNIKNIIEGEVA